MASPEGRHASLLCMSESKDTRANWQRILDDWVAPLVPWMTVPLLAAIVVFLLGSDAP